jgi:hypothetical protein
VGSRICTQRGILDCFDFLHKGLIVLPSDSTCSRVTKTPLLLRGITLFERVKFIVAQLHFLLHLLEEGDSYRVISLSVQFFAPIFVHVLNHLVKLLFTGEGVSV